MSPAAIHMICSSSSLLPSPLSSRFAPQKQPTLRRRRARAAAAVAMASSLRLGPLGVEDLAELVHNKVLVAAAVSAAVGQLAKPLTSAINGKGLDLMAAVRAGGMPSTHSSAVVAAATSLALERGFQDSIFGMSVVFAGLVMYDAQGVRREVGFHAKIINKIQSHHEASTRYWEDVDLQNSNLQSSSINCVNGEEMSALVSISEKTELNGSNPESHIFRSPQITPTKVEISSLKIDAKEPLLKNYSNYRPLNESIGHTELQVIVGAILGFVVSLLTASVL